MRKLIYLVPFIFICCNISGDTDKSSPEEKPVQKKSWPTPELTPEQASNLAELPIKCVVQEYPNKLGQTLGDIRDLKEPVVLHPAFYGCFDWHSAVHGHWSMVYLLKTFPQLPQADSLRSLLKRNINARNIAAEVAYFKGEHNTSYERTYGWAWLLKLTGELHTWDDPQARQLESDLQPLTDLIVERYKEFLPKLMYPIRTGEHPNTAFGMSFAYEYAQAVKDTSFSNQLKERARDFYLKDENCPLGWEPGGYDFLSPCLEEMNIMRLVLDENEFLKWMDKFLPQLKEKNYDLATGIVSDRTDGKLVHLDGLNFSRAWNLYALSNSFKEYEHLHDLADKHLQYSLPNVVGDDYEGGHWLGSFALYALKKAHN